MTEIASSDKMVVRPPCAECGKEVWGIAQVFHTIGTEIPVHLHADCYYRLKEINKPTKSCLCYETHAWLCAECTCPCHEGIK